MLKKPFYRQVYVTDTKSDPIDKRITTQNFQETYKNNGHEIFRTKRL